MNARSKKRETLKYYEVLINFRYSNIRKQEVQKLGY